MFAFMAWISSTVMTSCSSEDDRLVPEYSIKTLQQGTSSKTSEQGSNDLYYDGRGYDQQQDINDRVQLQPYRRE